jgi:hypothetical protein
MLSTAAARSVKFYEWSRDVHAGHVGLRELAAGLAGRNEV